MPADADDDGSCTAQRPLVFVGGYSELQGHIKGDQLLDGVRSFWLDCVDGSLQPCTAVEATAGGRGGALALPNPSMVCVDSRRRWLYSVCESSEGAVSAFRIGERGELCFLNRVALAGAAPCYVAVDREDSFVSLATYGGGTVESFPIQPDGSLLASGEQVIQHDGPSAPHAHSVVMDADNAYAVVCDLGLDQLLTYSLPRPPVATAARGGGELLAAHQTLQLPQGTGPSLFCFHPSGCWAYGGNESISSVSVYSYEAGRLSLRDTVSTTPPGGTAGAVATIDVHCSPCGGYLYASNCATNTLAVFACCVTQGSLTLVEHVSTRGEGPRSFAIEPGGRFLLVANQDTHEIVSFAIDARTGRLRPTGAVVSGVGSPTSICISPAPAPAAQRAAAL